jgi:hypothetical protein
MEGLNTQEVSEFVKGTAKSSRRGDVLEASHGSVSIPDPAMVLLKSVVEIYVGPMADYLAQFTPDRGGVSVVAVGGHSIRHDTSHSPGGAEERLGGGEVAMPAEHHVDLRSTARYKYRPRPWTLDVGLIDVPAATDPAAPATAEVFGQSGRQLCFPVPNRLVAEHDAANQEHLGEITQAQLVA